MAGEVEYVNDAFPTVFPSNDSETGTDWASVALQVCMRSTAPFNSVGFASFIKPSPANGPESVYMIHAGGKPPGWLFPGGRLSRYRFNARSFRTEHHLPFGRSRPRLIDGNHPPLKGHGAPAPWPKVSFFISERTASNGALSSAVPAPSACELPLGFPAKATLLHHPLIA